ncbi:MAG: transcription termination/antitermination protein NusG [Chloroflexi bacterium]|nr:transcription termination/antitermination protein NusG [Chloroflexota bacterium]
MTQPEDYNEDEVAFEGKSNLPTDEEGYPSGTPIEALEGAEPIDLESDSATEATVEEGFEAEESAAGTTDQETLESDVAFDNTADSADVAVDAQVEPTTRNLSAAVEPAPATKRPSLAPSTGQQENLGRRWYVIHTYSGYENKVKRALERRIESMDMRDKIYRIVVPTMEETEIKNGARHTVQRKVYPGYVLVEMMMTDESWYVVRNTQGVTSFVGSGNKPTPLIDEEVGSIMHQMEAEAPKVKTSFQVGQAVKIVDGPFSEFTGVIDSIDNIKNKITVMVSIFGRETPLTLDFLQVERIV